MRVDQTRHQHVPVGRNNGDISIRVDSDWIYRYTLNDILTSTLEGAESVALLPSKMRTF